MPGFSNAAGSSRRQRRTCRRSRRAPSMSSRRGSVLIYVKDKRRAFAEFHRVLRRGGRISLFEPINRFGMAERSCTWGYDLNGEAAKLMAKLSTHEATFQPPDDPMLDFDERDLLRLAE